MATEKTNQTALSRARDELHKAQVEYDKNKNAKTAEAKKQARLKVQELIYGRKK